MKKIRTAHGVTEYRLNNGMRFLHRYEKAAPVAAVCVTYHVGSRNEAPGHTGSTHILEHLLFKDSKNFNTTNGKAITGHLDWLGAHVNATTWFDRTNYFELLPSTDVEEALALEADRMRDSMFTDADLASEMTVVRNEFERGRNNPFELLDEAVMEKAYTTHPYRINTIGTKEDIEASTAAKLREFYNVFYWPNNATLMVVGDVPAKVAKALVAKYFEAIPASPHTIPPMKVKEPTQTKARSVSLRKPMGVGIASLYYKVPEGTHADFPAVLAAAMVLGGGFAARLQKALVDTGLAADVTAMTLPLYDPGVAAFSAHVAQGVAPQGVLKIMRREIERLAKDGPAQEELQRAQERVLAQAAAERDGALNEVRVVSEALAAGDWTLAYRLESAIKALTPAKVARVAAKYFKRSGETSGALVDAK